MLCSDSCMRRSLAELSPVAAGGIANVSYLQHALIKRQLYVANQMVYPECSQRVVSVALSICYFRYRSLNLSIQGHPIRYERMCGFRRIPCILLSGLSSPRRFAPRDKLLVICLKQKKRVYSKYAKHTKSKSSGDKE